MGQYFDEDGKLCSSIREHIQNMVCMYLKIIDEIQRYRRDLKHLRTQFPTGPESLTVAVWRASNECRF